MKIEILGIKVCAGKDVLNIIVGKEVPHFPEESVILDEIEGFPASEWVAVACKKDRLYIGTVDADYNYNTIVFVKDTSGIVEDIIVETY